MDNRIALVPARENLQHLHGNVRAHFAHEIHRIFLAPERRQDLIDLGDHVGRQMRNFEPVFDAEVGGHHAPAAAQRHDGDPFSLGQGQGGKSGGKVEQVHGLIGQDDACLAAGGVEDFDVGGHGARVACRSAAPGGGSAPLENDDGLFARHALRRFKEPLSVLDAFDVKDDGFGDVVEGGGPQIVLDGDHGFIARSAKGADADALRFGKGHELCSQVARLR